MAGLIYDVKYKTPSGKNYEISIFENTYGSEFCVSVYEVSKILFFTCKDRIIYKEYERDRSAAISFAENLALTPLITEK